MDFLLRCVVLSLSAAATGYVAGAVVSAVRLSRGLRAVTPSSVADEILTLRLLPLWGVVAALVFAVIGLARFESRDGDETIGWVLRSLAAGGALLVAGSVAHLALQQWRTMRLWQAWRRTARPVHFDGVTIPAWQIDAGIPIVAVIGVVRPRLVIDTSVLRHCDAAELAAIVAHECGHLRRRDNLRRLLFGAMPAPWMPAHLHERWREATEQAADDLAAAQSDARVHLASALVRVARLAQHVPTRQAWPAYLPASALYRGEALEQRVKRLLTTPNDVPAGSRRMSVTVGVIAVALAFAAQRQVHDVMERIVALLP
ncbi:MAG: hypothetical protein AMXMBFR57_06740 [Acidimicrobiia bacterium]